MTIKNRILSVEKYLYTRGYFLIYAAIVLFTSFSPVTVVEAVDANPQTQTPTETQTDEQSQPNTTTPGASQPTDTSSTTNSSTSTSSSTSSTPSSNTPNASSTGAKYDENYYNTNNILFYDPRANSCAATPSSDSINLIGNDNIEKIWNFFMSKGLTAEQTAGAIGNIMRESGGYPQRKQGRPESENYPDPNSAGGSGWGLIQWTPGGKVLDIAKRANITGPISELSTQLELVWWHLNNETATGKKNFINEFKQTKTVEEAVKSWEYGMEGAGDKAIPNRIMHANTAYAKYSKNPVTADGGTTTGTSADGCAVACSAQTAKSDVVLDPGHSKVKTIPQYNSEGIQIGEYSNEPELSNMFKTAQLIETKLKAKGYTVTLTKKTVDESMTHEKRVQVAEAAGAQLAVSLHSTPGTFGSASSGWVTEQKVGGYRIAKDGKKVTFNDQAVAAKSAEYAKAILAGRQKSEGGVKMYDISFAGRGGDIQPGNLPNVQLLSKIPWVYNEVGESGFSAEKYADGIANGIMQAIKPVSAATPGATTGDPNAQTPAAGSTSTAQTNTSQTSTTNTGSQSSTTQSTTSQSTTSQNTAATNADCASGGGGVVQTALNYAWPQNAKQLGKGYVQRKKVYEAAITKATAAGKYVGACGGVDCGGFVTRVMQDSGVDPDYGGGGNTAVQLNYVLSHSDKYEEIKPTSTADMKPGDIAIRPNDHTYMFIGAGLTGTDDNGNPVKFDSSIASASQCSRAPMAGWEKPADPKYRWFRLKAGAAGTATTAAGSSNTSTTNSTNAQKPA